MTDIPKGAKKPADHQKPAAQVEAEGIPLAEVSWRGHTFRVLSELEDWTVETTLAFETGRATVGIRGILGPEQWAELMKTKPLVRDLSELFDTIAKAIGLNTAGE